MKLRSSFNRWFYPPSLQGLTGQAGRPGEKGEAGEPGETGRNVRHRYGLVLFDRSLKEKVNCLSFLLSIVGQPWTGRTQRRERRSGLLSALFLRSAFITLGLLLVDLHLLLCSSRDLKDLQGHQQKWWVCYIQLWNELYSLQKIGNCS